MDFFLEYKKDASRASFFGRLLSFAIRLAIVLSGSRRKRSAVYAFFLTSYVCLSFDI